jgi:transcriptional regulator with PAS, ATPase and Fis domain
MPDDQRPATLGRSEPDRSFPRHFHLLSDQDLEDLGPISEAIIEHRGEIVRDWYQQYVLHFGDSRTFLQREFSRVFEDTLRDTQSALLGGDVDKYAAGISQLGELLAQQRMPLDEVIACLHLLKSIVARAVAQELTGQRAAAFDKLSHVQIILLVSTYFRSEATTAGERNVALEREAADLPASDRGLFQGLVGASVGMRQLYQRIEAASATNVNLFVVGESGTGKELVARAVHKCSPRAERPFVALNCAALPKDLIESELFGYKRGAFSGALAEYMGLFRAADGGTLFLDEITEMSTDTQGKLLRAIQERTVRPVGSTREQAVNVKLIASTNRDPQAAVASGRLRQDLYYRLQAAVLVLPPLRERRDDIPFLVEHLIRMFNQTSGRTLAGIETPALEALLEYDWPGNVRELSNAVEAAFTFGTGRLITVADLPRAIAGCRGADSKSAVNVGTGGVAGSIATFAEAERDLIARALRSNGGNKVRAAAQLKISRKKLYSKIAKYSLSETG